MFLASGEQSVTEMDSKEQSLLTLKLRIRVIYCIYSDSKARFIYKLSRIQSYNIYCIVYVYMYVLLI